MQVTVRFAVDVAKRSPRTSTVLVVSDDEGWRAQVCRGLEEAGYQVLSARHAGQALVESIRHRGNLDLLLTDGDLGQRRSDFASILKDHPHAALLHLPARPHTRDELLVAVTTAIA